MTGLLEGYKVIDLSWGLSGPLACMLLADAGATVIRIESPQGDPFGSPAPYKVWNRGKRSLTLDVRQEEGREILRRLASDADVLVESFRAGKTEALGIGYEELHRASPQLVYASISGYGQTSSRREQPGHDALVMAHLGLQAEQAGLRAGPRFNAFPAASYGAAMVGLFGICVALCDRLTSGKGQHVDTSLEDGALAMCIFHWGWTESNADIRVTPVVVDGRVGAPVRRLWMAMVECSDGRYLTFHSGAPGRFQRTMELLGLADKVAPSSSAHEMTESLTPEEGRFIQEEITRIFRTRPRDEWLERLQDADIAVAPVEAPGVILGDPQATFNHYGVAHLNDHEFGPITTVGNIWESPTSPMRRPGLAPIPGADTDAVLSELGLKASEIELLRKRGII